MTVHSPHPLFEAAIDRTESNSIKWNKYKGRDILPMWVADSDFPVPEAITDALHRHIDHGIFGYGQPPPRLAELLVERMQRKFNWQIQPEWIVYLPGLVCGLNLAVRSLTTEHQTVVSPAPIYPPFISAVKKAKRSLSVAPVTLQKNRWLVDFSQIEFAPETTLLLLCNPLNPGGTVYRRDELEQVLYLAEQHDLLICSDEIHCDLILEPNLQHIPFASLSESAAQRSVTLISPGKTFNLAGLGVSMAIIPNPTLRHQFCQAREGIVPEVNVLAYTAAQAAYEHGQPWLEDQLTYLRLHQQKLAHEINAMPYLKLHQIEATYLAWIDASALPVANPFTFFEQAGVGLSSGADFGNPHFVRMNFACSTKILEQALQRMRIAIEAL
ncbi:PatB family C-S lyase [Photobacterium sp.]|uniref:MalY/PatB family protein n=1 Tax=Photobacterium sp. TaxID=660 RepID=UPI00299E9552|nr:PatB family C-S lyase [Photobacterium sp.]MDX1304638.1 PatB family C-S lyase [Photobacterium sp.]